MSWVEKEGKQTLKQACMKIQLELHEVFYHWNSSEQKGKHSTALWYIGHCVKSLGPDQVS